MPPKENLEMALPDRGNAVRIGRKKGRKAKAVIERTQAKNIVVVVLVMVVVDVK